jgi:signal transduction histidine kinase
LSISYNIIEQHGGQITVKSDTDVGTEFTIRLPIKGVTE